MANEVKVGKTGALSHVHAVNDAALQEIVERASYKPIEELHAVLLREVEEVKIDPRLSGLGRAESVRVLVERHMSDLGKVERTINAHDAAKLQADRDAIDVALTDKNRLAAPKVPEMDRFIGELRAREVRDALRNLPSEERLRFALQAADESDITTLRAIHEAPRGLPLLDADAWNRVSALHRERHYGDQIARRNELDATSFQIRANFAAGRQAAARVLGEHFTPDELAKDDDDSSGQ